MRTATLGVMLASVIGLTTGAAAQAPSGKADVVAVTGCVKEPAAGTWTLVNATEPAVSSANAPSAKELASLPRVGTQQFRLIGVAEFDLPSHRDHTVVVKGLLIKATPMSRLNVTSVTMVAAACPPPAAK